MRDGTPTFSRRDCLGALSALPVSVALSQTGAARAQEPGGAERVTGTPFDFVALKAAARSLAGRPYTPPPTALPESLSALDWDRYQAIRFRPEQALWARAGTRFRLKFFHRGRAFRERVDMYEVVDGHSRPILYDPRLFDLGRSGVDAHSLPPDLGFAGFQVLFSPDFVRDVAAFLGASYFRAVGREKQYGLSARGLAIDCGMNRPEEFPCFTAFWFERPRPGPSRLAVHALLDSPSIAGAYRFDIEPGEDLVMNVEAALYPRKAIERLGIAPLTSMFLCGNGFGRVRDDWRPEIHDSDGLVLWTGSGERLFRPLTNPAAPRVMAHVDAAPRLFGLVQRDRNFDHYQDDGVFYDRRPSAWVEPLSDWGAGEVDLVELPAQDETMDNVVAFWKPDRRPAPGEELAYRYRLSFGANAPSPPPSAHVVDSWTGIGGVVGRERTHFSRRFVVDFAGPPLPSLGEHAHVEPVITTSSGEVELPSARPLRSVHGYRAMFDVKPDPADARPIDIRLFLRDRGRALTETWVHQWVPPPPAERTF